MPVGRLAAIVNSSHNAYHRDKVGFFGFPAFVRDSEVVRLLVSAVGNFLKQRGLESMRGPYSPSINDECGLLVDAFDSPPFVSMPWNAPYYEELLLDQGLQPVREMKALSLDLKLPVPERVARIVRRMEARSRLTMRPLDLRQIDGDMKIFTRLYNRTLDRNWGFVPIHLEDLRQTASELKAIADPEGILIVESEGRPAGFVICLPNINELLANLKSTPRWLRLPHFAWQLKTRRLTGTRLAVLGVDPAFRDRGISPWFFLKAQNWAARHFDRAEISWVEGNNREIMENSVMMGAVISKTYRIYEKSLP